MSSVDNLLGLHTDALCNVIVYSLPSVSLYRFGQVSKYCKWAVEEVAKMHQKDISLIARVTVFKEGEEEGEKTEVIITLPFTTCNDLKAKVEQIAQQNGITFNDDGNVHLALEPIKNEVPPNQENTVSTLLRQRVKMEIVLRLLELMKDDAKFSMLAPDAIFAMKLSGKLKDPGCLNYADLPPLVLFDLSAKNCSANELGKALGRTSRSAFRRVFPEVQSNIGKACFSHPHAQGICAWSLTQALAVSIGENSTLGRFDESLDLVGVFQGKGFMKGTFVETVSVTPPSKILSPGETKDLTIPKLIFAHPNAKDMDLKDSIDNMLLSAVRYRSPKLVQAVLNHPSSSHITDETLEIAIVEVPVEEPESIQAITNFIVNRAVKKKDQEKDEKKDEKCVVS